VKALRSAVLVAAAAGSLTIGLASPASAVTGSYICNSLSSKHNLWVSDYWTARSPVQVPIGMCSFHVGSHNTQGFFSGWNLRSPYGYVYSCGVWHKIAYNNTHLTLTVLAAPALKAKENVYHTDTWTWGSTPPVV
jgi:hypothetical protein